MLERHTARVVLLDAEGRIVLMKGRSPANPSGPACWYLVGGGVEPGESLEAAAVREVHEETGLTDVRLGPQIWYGEAIMTDADKAPVCFKERYLVAHTAGGAFSRAGWTEVEHALVDELRWWTLDELHLTDELVYPEGLADLLADVVAGAFPEAPMLIRTVDGPVRPPRAGRQARDVLG